ncbi:MAG: ArsR/SmtB family transcription factor [Ferrovibrio sp.]|jgi:DNA-binding transcriptional ArsR family regulator
MEHFTALADPTRRQIVELLGRGERAAGEIAEGFAISAPAVSQHLKVLREAGLVRVRVDGQRRIYELNPEGLAEIDAWLDRVRRFWAPRLDALEAELRKPAPAKRTAKGSKR